MGRAAYVKDEIDWEHCSLVTGFYECTREAWHGEFPVIEQTEIGSTIGIQAWMIEGKPWGKQPDHKPVSIPPINEILDRTVFGRGAIIPGLSADDFGRIRREALKRQLDPKKIPLFRARTPERTGGLVAYFSGHKELGTRKSCKRPAECVLWGMVA